MFRALKTLFLGGLLLSVLFILQPAQAQSSPMAQPSVAATPEAQLLRAILEELRLQRTTLQLAYSQTYRAQRLTEQLARQQARVDSLGEEITQLKAAAQQQDARDEDELKDLLVTINETADPLQRAALVQSYNSMKRAFERQREYARQEAERSRERQMQLESSLRAEQAKLAEMQEQFDALERELEKQFIEVKPKR